ncbi:MAG: septum formation initiator family protein [Clostridia bacterium]|jgi:cell division protein FtsB|nr:septum formation initiator family protein [Clostridia bacterium]
MNKIKLNKKTKRTAFIVLVLIVFIIFVVVFVNRFRKKLAQDEQISSMKSTVSQIEDENSKISETLANSEDESYIEKVAREDYNYVKPEERIYYDSDGS